MHNVADTDLNRSDIYVQDGRNNDRTDWDLNLSPLNLY